VTSSLRAKRSGDKPQLSNRSYKTHRPYKPCEVPHYEALGK
jgi:hypothetical protein